MHYKAIFFSVAVAVLCDKIAPSVGVSSDTPQRGKETNGFSCMLLFPVAVLHDKIASPVASLYMLPIHGETNVFV